MSWVKLDDNCIWHPKVASLSDGAFRLWIAGLCQCQRFLTDGRLDQRALKTLPAFSERRLRELSDSSLWTRCSDGGVLVHDYLTYQPSRNEVTQRREDTRERMRKIRAGGARNVR